MKEKPDFVGHLRFSMEEIARNPSIPINNWVVEGSCPDDDWIKATTASIGEWRSYFRSTYIRWALAINGLCVAHKHYESRVHEDRAFTVSSIRADGIDQIAQWDFETASHYHFETVPMIAAWGLVDLYSCLEEFVFEFYTIYLNHHPDSIIRGEEFKELRRLRRNASHSDKAKNEWDSAWAQRLSDWQRKRIYDGLYKVFLAYANTAGLKTPSIFTQSTVETWAEVIQGFGELRNCFSHGVQTVNKELSEFSKKPYSLAFDFKEGEPLVIELKHLQSVECFLDQLLTAINLSLIERAGLPLPEPK